MSKPDSEYPTTLGESQALNPSKSHNGKLLGRGTYQDFTGSAIASCSKSLRSATFSNARRKTCVTVRAPEKDAIPLIPLPIDRLDHDRRRRRGSHVDIVAVGLSTADGPKKNGVG